MCFKTRFDVIINLKMLVLKETCFISISKVWYFIIDAHVKL